MGRHDLHQPAKSKREKPPSWPDVNGLQQRTSGLYLPWRSRRTSDAVFIFLAHTSEITAPTAIIMWLLYSRRWFHRVWVLQEVAMARSARIYCGNRIISWEDFVSAVSELKGPGAPFFQPPILNMGLYYLRGRDIIDLLIRTTSCRSTDPQDKVFALLALVSKEVPLPVKADYTKDTNWAFVQVAAWSIQRRHDLRILSYSYRAESHAEPHAIGHAATWIPTWGPKTIHFALPIHELTMTISSEPYQPQQLITEEGNCTDK